MSGSVFDAVVLLAADGLVAVGRVLGGLRRRCDTEQRADAVDALNALEDNQDGLEPGDLTAFGLQWPTKADKDRAFGELKDSLDRIAAAERGEPMSECPHDSLHGLHGAPDWYCNSCGAAIPQRSAAVTVPAADNTTQADHLEAAWNYHTGAIGYSVSGDAGWQVMSGIRWICEGCTWTGPTEQAHARHRFQVLADMKNATTRVQEQLGGTA